MKRYLLLTFLTLMTALTGFAQRTIDHLDRGLVAMKTTSGVFLSWRIQSDEYFDVKYNVYRNGTKVASDLNVSNYTDASGSTSSTYTVAAVVRGKEQSQCAAVTPWASDYFDITPKHDSSLKCTYVPNDACCADVDGDGQVEILLKYDNSEESSQLYPKAGPTVNGTATGEYTLFEVLKLDGTVLWWVNCGPNMGDFQNNEQNIVGYDWDQDGKAEVVMRLEEGSVVHMADGTTYTIGADGKNGTSWTNYREPKVEGGVEWFTHYGNEFLFYCNGATGKPYQCITFPLKRLESGETDLGTAWGDGYGHRSSKYFFGAPYLDGRHPSMFLGRGIYTRHKFIAYDVDPNTHALTTRWTWTNNQKGSPWYGQGYHNYGIVDVDWDGRDEIVWGSMVIDDNGKGLSTTGLGHGDAQHHGDFDPYTHGQEGFFCNEDAPSNNYRDLTTSSIYHRATGTNDDGRSICGNFSNSYPGAMGFSAHDNPISCVTGSTPSGMASTGVTMNFRCYWDGDLQEESFNGTATRNSAGAIFKYGNGSAIKTLTGTLTNNDSKATPSYMGDILGDWREEFIMRTSSNGIRIYSTTTATKWRNYSLWYDKQYRNGMVWEPCGYNQPPHVSYFLGELEGITAAPPAETMTGRTEVANGGTISNNDETVITCETNDMSVNVANGATPYIYIDNAPSWVQGSAPSEATSKSFAITYKYYTHTLTGGAFAGSMRLIKQGDGTLVLPNVTETYTGNTDVWAGSLNFDGTLQNSKLWLNRFAELNSDGGKFMKGIKADYASVIRPGGVEAKASSITTDTLALGFGAKVELDLYSDGLKSDKINANVLSVEKKTWSNGPAYSAPVFVLNVHPFTGATSLAAGKYDLGTVGAVVGSLSNIVVEGLGTDQTGTLSLVDGKLMLEVVSYTGEALTWKGGTNSTWDINTTANFISDNTGEASKFVPNSAVTFNDNATRYTVAISGNAAPSAVTFNNTKTYTISGDSLIGGCPVTKSGTGIVYLKNVNHVGNTTINGGTLYVNSLANSVGTSYGSLGDINNTITIQNGYLGVNANVTSGQKIIFGTGVGGVKVDAGYTLTQAAAIALGDGGTFTKTGQGTLSMTGALSAAALNVSGGAFNYTGTAYSKQVTLAGSSSIAGTGFLPTPVEVASGATATWSLTNANYSKHSGALTGSGTITIVPTNTVNRVSITGDWSAFTGTVKFATAPTSKVGYCLPFNNSYGLPNATLNVASGCYVANTGKTFTIGKLTGAGILEQQISDFNSQSTNFSSNTWRVGNSTLGDFAFDGQIYDAGGSSKSNFEKIGTCKMTVNASWANSGTVKVSEGELHLLTGKTLGTGALTVAEGAILSGLSGTTTSAATKAPMTNSSFTINGTLQIGSSATSTTGLMNFNGKNVTFGSNGVLDLGIYGCSSSSLFNCTSIGNFGTLTMPTGSTVKVHISSSYSPAATEEVPDSFHVAYSFTKMTLGNVNFDLPTISGYEWDTSLFDTGYLYLYKSKGASGINAIMASEQVHVDVVGTNGAIVATYNSTMADVRKTISFLPLSRGIYVLRVKSASGNYGTMTIRK